MVFENDVQQQFIDAGWKEGRDVFSIYRDIPEVNAFPGFLKTFLKEYGDLTVLEAKKNKSESGVTNKFEITLVFAGFGDKEVADYYEALLGKPVFAFAFFYPDSYRIACDSVGKIYLLGDYTFLVSEDFQAGIELLIRDDWSNGFYQLNEETKQWKKNKRWDE